MNLLILDTSMKSFNNFQLHLYVFKESWLINVTDSLLF